MAVTVADILNMWNEIGVFSYVLPFLLIFAVVFAILDKTKLLSGRDAEGKPTENKAIISIIAVSMALLSLQFDFVSEFFAVIFPRFGIGLSLFLVFLIFVGFFLPAPADGKGLKGGVIGWVIGVGVVIWALSSWKQWTGDSGFGGWFVEYIWALVVLGVIIGLIVLVSKKSGRSSSG